MLPKLQNTLPITEKSVVILLSVRNNKRFYHTECVLCTEDIKYLVVVVVVLSHMFAVVYTDQQCHRQAF